jgi:hypothetical protein
MKCSTWNACGSSVMCQGRSEGPDNGTGRTLDLNLYRSRIGSVEGNAGRDHTYPQLLICLWLHAYSPGISSAQVLRDSVSLSRDRNGFQVSN